jgi:hypothetical protein
MKLEKMDGRGEGDKEEENKVGWIKWIILINEYYSCHNYELEDKTAPSSKNWYSGNNIGCISSVMFDYSLQRPEFNPKTITVGFVVGILR